MTSQTTKLCKLVTAVTFLGSGLFIGGYVRSEEVTKEKSTWLAKGGHVFCLAFSPDGKTIASGGLTSGTVQLWDVASGKEKTTFEGHKRQVESVAFSPDGKLLASSDVDGTINLWNLENGKGEAQIEDPKDGFRHLAFSPSNKTLASGCWTPKRSDFGT